MVTDAMVEAHFKVLRDIRWDADVDECGNPTVEDDDIRRRGNAALLAALAAVPVGEEVERVAGECQAYAAPNQGDAVSLEGQVLLRAASLLRSLSASLAAVTAERDEAIRQRDQAVEALSKIEATPAWGYPDRWEVTPSEVRQLARATLAAIRKEGTDEY